ncbi:MAG: lipopolysaccharide biosynthesis protein [Clostridia bacterium]|nr:lipopolysaccharide biosynthesis protein [Clostridia bacterium]
MKVKQLSKIQKLKNVLELHFLNAPARSSLYFTAANLIAKGASFLFTPIFTRLLTSVEYGEYSLFSSFLSVGIVLVTLEIPGGIIMRAFQRRRGLEHISVLTASMLSLLLTLPVSALLFLFTKDSGLNFPLANFFLFLSLASLSFINLYISKCKFLYNWHAPFVIALLQSIITPILSISLIRIKYFKGYDHVSLKIGTGAAVSVIIATVLIIVSIKKSLNEAVRANIGLKDIGNYAKELLPFLLKLALPLLPYYFSVMLISQADKLTISNYLGKAALGRYSVAYSAGIALTAVTGGIMSALCPWIMRKVRAGDIALVRRALGTISCLSLPVIIIFLCVSPEIYAILAPKEYESALPVLFIIASVPLPLSVSQCLCTVSVAKEKTLGVLISGLIPAAFAWGMNLLLIGQKSILIPAIITALSYIILMLCEMINTRKIIGKAPINVNKTFQTISFIAFLSAFVYVFKEYIIIRVSVIIISLAYLLYMLKRTKWLLGERRSDKTSA